MSLHGRNLTPDQRRLLQLVFTTFRETGAWPKYLFVERKLDSECGADLFEVGRPILGDLIMFDPHRAPASEVLLPISGIACCDGSKEDLKVFLVTLHWLVACQQDWQPQSPSEVTPPDVGSLQAKVALKREGISVDNLGLARAGSMARLEGLFDSASHQPDTPWVWSGVPARSLRDLRGVKTLEDYQKLRPGQSENAEESIPVSTQLPARRIQGDATPPGVGQIPYVFILMPFDEVWSDRIRDLIDRSCATFKTEGFELELERADEIAKPGRITEQIVEAIRRADLIIADITGNNPNVMFELGFADALNKPIIVLNQRLSATPFDIKDWRAIAYSLEGLDAAEDRLTKALSVTLRD